jgi:hypothetical protein
MFTQQCELCEREVDTLTVHHLIPKQQTKRKDLDPGPTVNICSACHRQIHALFENSHLARKLNSLEKLKDDPQLQKFLIWVRKQDPNKRVKMDRKRG